LLKDRLKWLTLAAAFNYFLTDVFGSRAYPQWKGQGFPTILELLWQVSGTATVVLTAMTLPRWQSVVGLATVLLVMLHGISI
jgi:hypothetical protein